MSCRDVRDWLHRDAALLDETQRLLLDDHLAACEQCRGDRERMRAVHELGAALVVPPAGARDYNRAIARALLEGARREPAPRRWGWLMAIAIPTVAAASVTGYLVLRDKAQPIATKAPTEAPIATKAPDVRPPPQPPAPRPDPVDVVEAGMLADGDLELTTGAAVPADKLLQARELTRAKLGALRVVIAAATQLRWSPIERLLLLERGSVEIESTPPGGRIATDRFEIEVDDASATIEMDAVHVRRGGARVVDRSHGQVAQLAAGDAWSPTQPKPHAPRAKSFADLLAEARKHFAAAEYGDAERLGASALAAAQKRSDQIDVRMFLADVAQAAGKLEVAVARYESVASELADLPAAESALYAAARIEARRGRSAEARSLLERYLARYPNGRYSDDVRRQLGGLP